jgi:PAS domain S-box-containing protein
VRVRPRQIAPIALLLGLAIAGFVIAHLLAERDARRDAEHRAEVAAAQMRDRVAQGASLTESLRRFMLDAVVTGVTSDRFARNASRWLSPADFPAAAWVERVPRAQRAAYERRTGEPIVTPDALRRIVPPDASYFPATLVSGFPPFDLPAIDLGGVPGMAATMARATRLGGVAATPMTTPRTGPAGLYLVAPAPTLVEDVLLPGHVVVFVPEATLREATDEPTVRITAPGARARPDTAVKTFAAAGRQFDVAVPQESVQGGVAAVPWIVLAAGVILAGLAAALGVNAARRARAQEELDRIFTLSPDVIAVADFDGHFTRVNPAVEQVLGYTQEEFLARPYLDLVHPDDRARTGDEVTAIGHGKTTLAFENQYLAKDGTYRVLEWTAAPVVEQQTMYGVARDVTDRRRAQAELARLAGEQAALRRVATLVAEEAPQAAVFTAIAEEAGRLIGIETIRMLRYEQDGSALVVATWGKAAEAFPTGSRVRLEGDSAAAQVLRTGLPVRIDDYTSIAGPLAASVRAMGIRTGVAVPILVDGRLWGAMTANTTRDEPLPPDTEVHFGDFTELLATAIANTEARAEVARLAEEQAALRRVAVLVAEGAPPSAVFDAVAGEMEALLDADQVALNRFQPDDEIVVLAHRGLDVARTPVGSRVSTKGQSVTAMVRRTGKPARMEGYRTAEGAIAELARATGLRSSVSAPIVVEGRVWGVITASWKHEQSPPPETEQRMARFAELLGTAIVNAHTRDQLTASRARLLTAGDDARRRVVRDLHDGAQQRLVNAIVSLKLAQRALRDEEDSNAEELVDEALVHAEEGNEALRELARGILPSALTRGGLQSGVGSLAARLNVPVDVDVPARRFPAEIEASAYFIVAEALTNVVKHSRARRAGVRVSPADGALRVEVRDDGVGGADPDGHGLVGMRDRVTVLGGTLHVESPPGGGTLVSATLPLATAVGPGA